MNFGKTQVFFDKNINNFGKPIDFGKPKLYYIVIGGDICADKNITL